MTIAVLKSTNTTTTIAAKPPSNSLIYTCTGVYENAFHVFDDANKFQNKNIPSILWYNKCPDIWSTPSRVAFNFKKFIKINDRKLPDKVTILLHFVLQKLQSIKDF